MKIIDKTPLQDEKGDISFSARVQGTLKYGLSWFSDLEAQKNVIGQLNRTLEKGFVLIRNLTLPGSDIVIPIILIGQSGIQVIYITQVKGFFEAKGDQWNTVNNGRAQPAGINLIDRVAKFGRALQRYMEIHKIDVPAQIEPVLIAADPGAHVESMRPVARVVMSDAIKQFGASLLQARPVLRPDQVFDLAERIVNPPPPQKPPQPAQSTPPDLASTATFQRPAAPPASSRSQAIFKSEQTPFDPNDMGFAFEDGEGSSAQATPAHLRESNPAQPLPSQSAKSNKIMGMTSAQLALLAVMAVVECCVLIGFAYIISTTQ